GCFGKSQNTGVLSSWLATVSCEARGRTSVSLQVWVTRFPGAALTRRRGPLFFKDHHPNKRQTRSRFGRAFRTAAFSCRSSSSSLATNRRKPGRKDAGVLRLAKAAFAPASIWRFESLCLDMTLLQHGRWRPKIALGSISYGLRADSATRV